MTDKPINDNVSGTSANDFEETAVRCAEVALLDTTDRQTRLSLLAAAGKYARGARAKRAVEDQ